MEGFKVVLAFIAALISWVLNQFIISILTWLVYKLFVISLIGIEISLVNWFGIILISSCILPSGRIIKHKPNKPESKEDKFNIYGRG